MIEFGLAIINAKALYAIFYSSDDFIFYLIYLEYPTQFFNPSYHLLAASLLFNAIKICLEKYLISK